jgi:hypothetical protein
MQYLAAGNERVEIKHGSDYFLIKLNRPVGVEWLERPMASIREAIRREIEIYISFLNIYIIKASVALVAADK